MITPTRRQEQAGAVLGITYAAGAYLAHLLVPKSWEPPLGLEADPWYRAEIGSVNAGFLYGAVRHLRGAEDATFLRSTGISALLMALTRSIATVRGFRGGRANAGVIAIDVVLGVGSVAASYLYEHDPDAA